MNTNFDNQRFINMVSPQIDPLNELRDQRDVIAICGVLALIVTTVYIIYLQSEGRKDEKSKSNF